MTDKQWAPEPWTTRDGEIYDANDNSIIEEIEYNTWSIDEDSLPRIIACVNACAGVPTEVLEHPNFHGMCKIVCEIAMVGEATHEAKEPPDATES